MSTLRADYLKTLDDTFIIPIKDLQASPQVQQFIADLLNNTDLLKGAALVGRATRQVVSLAELKTISGRYTNDLVTMLRHTSGFDFGGGPLYWDAASTEAANDVTIIQATGVTVGRWKRLDKPVTLGMFGGRPVTGFDNATALAAMETFLRTEKAAFRAIPRAEIDAGTYEYSVAPNFGIEGATIVNKGKVKLRYTGTGHALLLDSGGINTVITNITFGQGKGFIVEAGPAATLSTVYLRNIYKSEVRTRCWGAGLTAAGFLIEGCVLTDFYIGTTPTESASENPADYTNGWYHGAKPFVGMTVTQSTTGRQTAYCNFYDWLGAACQIGMYFDYTLGNLLIGGDNEYNTNLGSVFTANAIGNRLRGTNFEVNTNGDVECAGNYNSFDVDSVLFKFTSGSGNELIGGMHDQVSVLGGVGHYVGEIVYGRGLSGNLVIVDNGTNTAFGRCYQAQSQRWSMGPSKTGSISVGPSPFTYTNNTNMPIKLFIQGGVSGNITYYRASAPLGILTTNSCVTVSPADSVLFTYTVAPTLTYASE